jgi:hypothetical protein
VFDDPSEQQRSETALVVGPTDDRVTVDADQAEIISVGGVPVS